MNLGERIGNSLSCEFLPPSINWKRKKSAKTSLPYVFLTLALYLDYIFGRLHI